jgi:hypothetical protein
MTLDCCYRTSMGASLKVLENACFFYVHHFRWHKPHHTSWNKAMPSTGLENMFFFFLVFFVYHFSF